MKHLKLTELLKSDAGLLFLDRVGALDIPGNWYINAPLGVWALVGLPVTISLAERLVTLANHKPGRIVGFSESALSPAIRSIPFNVNGKNGVMLASSAPVVFNTKLPADDTYAPAVWHVPIDGNPVTVRKSELRAFLDGCHKRSKHQFSRRYWTRQRRPPLYRPKYEAFMRLLTESGLVEGRHDQGGASGYLVTFPHEAIMYLKYQSAYRI
jgi:hypothetical protein